MSFIHIPYIICVVTGELEVMRRKMAELSEDQASNEGGYKVHTYTHTYTYIHTSTYTHINIHIYTYTHTHINIHTHTHAHIHTHTHIGALRGVRGEAQSR
jgi:hypothetical protein